MNHSDILMCESLKKIITLSHLCKTENGIEPDEHFYITKIIGAFDRLEIMNQFNRKLIINPNQIEGSKLDYRSFSDKIYYWYNATRPASSKPKAHVINSLYDEYLNGVDFSYLDNI